MTDISVLHEILQKLEAAIKHNTSKGRTVIVHEHRCRADRLRKLINELESEYD